MSPRLAGTPDYKPPEVEQPHTDERGYEHHPAWALLGAYRTAGGGSDGGRVLFDSDLRHNHTVVIKLSTARRKRDLHRDWIGSDRQVFEVEMSEAQWASFVSSMNAGDGVPCTVRFAPGAGHVPLVPYEPRLRESMDEVRTKADDVVADIQAAFEAFEERPIKANRERLKYAIKNAAPNVEFAARSLSEHAENVVQRARADVEAMVVAKAEQLGLDPADIGTLELEAGEQERS